MFRKIPHKITLFVATLFSLIFALFLFQNCNDFSEFSPAADFEPLETVYLVWNDEDSTLLVNMMNKISKYEHVTLFIRDEAEIQEKIAEKITLRGGNLANVHFVPKKMLTNNNWIRDYAPLFIRQNDRLKMVKFTYWDASNEVVDFISLKDTLELKKANIQSFGGTRELNGLGVGIFVEEHEKFITRKEGFDKKKHEEKLKKEFNLKKVIWLKKGIPQDELPSYGPIEKNIYPTGSCHHIDEFCRFISPNKIVISYVGEKEATNEILREAKRRLDENYRILQNSTDQDGNPFEIIRIPFAPVLTQPFYSMQNPDVLRTEVTSYLNFLITNNTVILPTYQNKDTTELTKIKEGYILKTFAKHFPEKELVFLDVGSLNTRGGGIHCISAAKPLHLNKPKQNLKLWFRKNRKT